MAASDNNKAKPTNSPPEPKNIIPIYTWLLIVIRRIEIITINTFRAINTFLFCRPFVLINIEQIMNTPINILNTKCNSIPPIVTIPVQLYFP
jgi:hypothetical protein